MNVLLTRPWPQQAVEKIRAAFEDLTIRQSDQPMSDAEMTEALRTYDIIAPTLGDRFQKPVFDAVGTDIKTKLLANFGVGYDHIDVSSAAQHHIYVSNTPDVLTDATAEIAILLMLMAARKSDQAQAMLCGEPGWTGWTPTQSMGVGLKGKTLGIVGMGRIGKEVARRAYLAFGMDVVFYNRTPKRGIIGLVANQIDDLTELCKKADFVSVHAAATPDTRHLMGPDQVAAIGPQGFLINTARGDLVDEDAVMDALDSGALGGAGLDVFQGEPSLNPRWFRTPGVTMLPHIGSATVETRTAMGLKALANMKALVAGEALPNLVAPA